MCRYRSLKGYVSIGGLATKRVTQSCRRTNDVDALRRCLRDRPCLCKGEPDVVRVRAQRMRPRRRGVGVAVVHQTHPSSFIEGGCILEAGAGHDEVVTAGLVCCYEHRVGLPDVHVQVVK